MKPSGRARAILDAARTAKRSALSEEEAKTILAEFGIAVPQGVIVPRGQTPSRHLRESGGPYAIKVVSPTILHKSDVGGVRVGVAGTGVDQAVSEMDARITAAGLPIEGWLIEEMAPEGIEVVIGGTFDARFGPCVMVGLGGVLVELIADVSFRLCPIDRRDAREMIDELRGAKLLRGWRGAPSANEEAMIQALLGVGGECGLMTALSDVVGELDINPLIVSPEGAVAADARIIIREISP